MEAACGHHKKNKVSGNKEEVLLDQELAFEPKS